MSAASDLQARHPLLSPYFAKSDVVDIKQIEGRVSLRQFVAGLINYQPAWVTALYSVRWLFVRLLGMRQEGVPTSPALSADTVPMQAGAPAGFFTVVAAKEDQYWLVKAEDTHLTAFLGVVVNPGRDGRNHFDVLTLVHYHRWTGPVYFNVIRPFHHLVVGSMMNAGVRNTSG